MKSVNICHVFAETFFIDGVEWKYKSSYNSRVVCTRVDDPSVEVQFSAYETVQVSDEQAEKSKFVLLDSYRSTRCRLREMKDEIKSLTKQGVKSPLDHYMEGI